MARTFQPPLPTAAKQTQALGERLRLARRRRNLSTVVFAEQMGVSRETLRRLEAGDPNVALGTYLRALSVLGLDKDIDAVGRDDDFGRKLQELALTGTPRVPSSSRAARLRAQPAEHAAAGGEPMHDTCSEGDDYGD
ncbi:MAG: helix-turn-helix domain-containing protein [Ramlibacter sp.]